MELLAWDMQELAPFIDVRLLILPRRYALLFDSICLYF